MGPISPLGQVVTTGVLGEGVGTLVGASVDSTVGAFVGVCVGVCVGAMVGALVGAVSAPSGQHSSWQSSGSNGEPVQTLTHPTGDSLPSVGQGSIQPNGKP
jgi:hypothetical protein